MSSFIKLLVDAEKVDHSMQDFDIINVAVDLYLQCECECESRIILATIYSQDSSLVGLKNQFKDIWPNKRT